MVHQQKGKLWVEQRGECGFCPGICCRALPQCTTESSHFLKSVSSFKISKGTLVACNVLNASQDEALGAENKVVLKNSLKSSWKHFLFVENNLAWLAQFSFSVTKEKLSCLCIISSFKNLKKTERKAIWYNMHPMKRQVWCQDKLCFTSLSLSKEHVSLLIPSPKYFSC